MKLVDHFDTLLSDVVNLNATRVKQLEDSIEALEGVIEDSDWGPTIKYFKPQGSWAHKTIIKPVEGGAFDADLLIFIEPVKDWEAKEYLATLKAVFKGNNIYKDKVRRYSHCVTIEYAGERKIDLAPCIVDRGGVTRFEVCNFNTNEFEESKPQEYTAWLIDRNGWTTGNALRKVTRLLKYLRDIKGTFSCASVLFSTLLGYRIDASDANNSAAFTDVPTALKTIVGRLDGWLQANSSRPTVTNPVLSSEIFSDLWDDDQYANFRERINTYRKWIDEAYDEQDRDESIGKWRRVFGDDFARSVVIQKAARVSQDSASTLVENSVLARGAGFGGDLVARFSRFGRGVLPVYFDRLPHKERPRWPELSVPLFSISVTATLHVERGGPLVKTVSSGDGPLPKRQWLRFQARTSGGALPTGEFEVHWRVTNTDREAAEANCLRGGFVRPTDGQYHWEQLSYRGIHSVEAFVVRKRNVALVARSEPFYVVIE